MTKTEQIAAVAAYLEACHPLAAPVSKIAVMTLLSESQVRAALRAISPPPLKLKRGSAVAYMRIPPTT